MAEISLSQERLDNQEDGLRLLAEEIDKIRKDLKFVIIPALRELYKKEARHEYLINANYLKLLDKLDKDIKSMQGRRAFSPIKNKREGFIIGNDDAGN